MLRPLLPVLLTLLLALPAQAHVPCPPQDCIAIRPPPEIPFVTGLVHLDAFRATLEVRGDLAETRLAMELAAPGNAAAEATLAFPMPGGATLLGFNLTVDGRVLEGRVQESQAAQQAYQEAKEQGKDAVLLQQADDRRLVLNVNLPAGAHRTLAAHYVEWVDSAGGARIYRLPLARLPADVGRVDVEATLDGAGLKEVAAPLLPLTLAATATHATASAHLAAPGPLKDLVLTWGVPSGWQAAVLASTAQGWGEGVAVACLGGGASLARDVVFILDRSGSMAGAKIAEARESLRAVLPTLLPGDFYDIVLFDDMVDPLHGHLQAATAQAVAQDQSDLAGVQQRGSTDLDGGLQRALAELNGSASDRLPMIVLLTDGLPTAGVTDHQRIIQRFVDGNARHARLHVVPIGLDADYTFLADLALRSGGSFTPLDPGDGQLALRLGRLYDVLGHPLLRDVEVTLSGVPVADVRPRALPDVAVDQCLHVAFRADWSGQAGLRLTVTGRDAAGPVHQEFSIARSAVAVRPAVAALWGRAQVDELLAQEHAGEATRAAVVANATQYRQLSPYTAWVIVDSQAPPPPAGANDAGALGGASASALSGTASATGQPSSTQAASGTRVASPYGTVRSVADHAANQAATGAVAHTTNATPGLGLAALLAVALLAALASRRRLPPG
ncbi:MAG: Ca-activated chloride channel [Thermoplasmata archaeon]|jgi:Ca-activated chloride channel family protein|nr:Ca-activated chloride channel [Thermoplasmata archaeon]